MSESRSRHDADPGRRIAYQGMPGANSHIICGQAYPDMDPVPCRTFEDAFAAVRDAQARYAMIPIENSVAGRVADIHHLLPESGLFIVGEHFLRVRYQLMAPRGARLEGLRRVVSHVQALAQCRTLIHDLGLEAVAHADTAGAARDVAARNDPAEAAIAPPLAAEIYGLDVLRSHIEDVMGNTTRFVVMSRRREEPDPDTGPALTSFVFQVRNVPAALYKALGGFATNGVNMVKLESYMTDNSFSATQFYAEIEGHPLHKPVERALEELQYFSNKLRIIGVYPRSDFRGSA